MNKISIPKERAYYLASENEKHRLLCWIPVEEYDHLIQEGRIPQYVRDDYPDGLELDVSGPGFDEFQVDLGVSPEALKEAYARLRTRARLPQSGTVAGATLELIAGGIEQRGNAGIRDLQPRGVDEPITPELPEPAMTEGEDAMLVMRGLDHEKGVKR
jgi:hypothetical protein